jgi:hypothetical protein
MHITDNRGNINNEMNMRQRRNLHVCQYVRTHTHTHTHTHTQKMRGSAKKGICVNLTDDGKENPATEVL